MMPAPKNDLQLFCDTSPHNLESFKGIGDMNSTGASSLRKRKIWIDVECVSWRQKILCGICCGIGVERGRVVGSKDCAAMKCRIWEQRSCGL